MFRRTALQFIALSICVLFLSQSGRSLHPYLSTIKTHLFQPRNSQKAPINNQVFFAFKEGETDEKNEKTDELLLNLQFSYDVFFREYYFSPLRATHFQHSKQKQFLPRGPPLTLPDSPTYTIL